jgi:hypothetical protein
MNVKHTPGPFFFKRGIGRDPRDFIVVDSTGNTVAETNVALYMEGDEELEPSVRPITLEEAIANAHLFAAAPDMLAALKAADDACSQIVAPEDWPRKEIRAAISKAEPRDLAGHY